MIFEQKKANNNKDNKIKLILLGESGTGKTSLINAYNGIQFKEVFLSTCSANYIKKEIEINENIYNVILWDTAGQERFRSVNKIFIKDSQIVIFVYDITKRGTFIELEYWVNYVRQILPENVIFGVAGNKIDLLVEENNEINNNEYVTKEEGQQYADKIGATFCETSAKEDPEGFIDFVRQLLGKCVLQKISIKKEASA